MEHLKQKWSVTCRGKGCLQLFLRDSRDNDLLPVFCSFFVMYLRRSGSAALPASIGILKKRPIEALLLKMLHDLLHD
ncbi:hypothetical protein [Faecalibaculum rodentium]|uniref:Uncharacterized protein n=1 Tax=Faecalibaculum rodentium TaxID=1702221 RepID=A0A140DSV3_9FIRM|nr:hypothetical protein [Faecalibaculum rodentium]AMK53730.1 hypothetical protein AALO17_05960 [Faecalibaculum rodentium]